MDEMTVFEERFEQRVRTFALSGVRPVDSVHVASSVVVGQRRDRSSGPSVRWRWVPLDRRAWTIAVGIGLLVALLGGALLVGARLLNVAPPVTNGWIAFTVRESGPDGESEDLDIWLVALDREARRVVGGETDRVHQLCPAFSPDGRSLAYGQVEGHGTENFSADDGTEGTRPASYRQAALIVADVSADGRVSDEVRVDVGDGLPPPCPIWSPDGRQIAFGVNRTSPINPETSAAGSEVWVVTVAGGAITVLPDLLATDLDWSPDGRVLAIASGKSDRVRGEMLRDGRVYLYQPASGEMRTLEATPGAVNVTWSPDGHRIAWAGRSRDRDSSLELRVLDVDTGRDDFLGDYSAIHGVGPAWSPDGTTIAYQRCRLNPCSSESHEVVLVTPADRSDARAIPDQRVIPFEATASGSHGPFYPWHVSWSPDSEYLLYVAWGRGDDDLGPALVAVPAELDREPIVVVQMEGMAVNDGYPDTTLVPIQTWGRASSE
jgi:hypothetical protein